MVPRAASPDTAEVTEGEGLSPRARRVAKTRRAIVDAARDLFEEQGYDGTTIDQIADRADIAPRTFFRYFRSKEALVFADMSELRNELFGALDERPRTEHPLKSLIHALAEHTLRIEENYDRVAWGFRISHAHDGLKQYEMTVLKAETAERVRAFVAERLDVDPDVDPRPQAWAMVVMGMFVASLHTTLGDDDPPAPGAVHEAFLGLVRETIGGLKGAIPR
jgi:AcrR family transcriptional regulator